MPVWVITKEIKMNELEQKLEDLLERLSKVLDDDDMELLRYACGKTQTRDILTDMFNDFGTIFGESKK